MPEMAARTFRFSTPERKIPLASSLLQEAQSCRASVAIEDGALLVGELPPRQLRMVQVWVDLHRDELLADWELAKEGVEPFRIDPLK